MSFVRIKKSLLFAYKNKIQTSSKMNHPAKLTIIIYIDRMKTKIEDQLDEVQLAIDGALANPKIRTKLEKFGYTQKVLKEGKGYIEKVNILSTLQDESYGIQKNATKQLLAARQEAHTLYMRHLSIVRIALSQQIELWDVLKLEGARKKNFSGWLGQVNAFYGNISRVQEVIEKHGITQAEIAQVQEMIKAISQFRVEQLNGKSEKEQATKKRKAALKSLQGWMRDFLYIARHALKDDPQQLEALGQVVK